jgi:hypothetical protein
MTRMETNHRFRIQRPWTCAVALVLARLGIDSTTRTTGLKWQISDCRYELWSLPSEIPKDLE